MAEPARPARLTLGAPVRCADGLCGELADLVVDARAMRVTHLIVEPHREHDGARLVALALAGGDHAREGEIPLRCTVDEVADLPAVRDVAFLELGEAPAPGPGWDVGVQEIQAVPSSALDGLGVASVVYGVAGTRVAVAYDRVPEGRAEVRRASPVLSADGHDVGHVAGVALGAEGRIDEIVIAHGHLWGRRETTIPAEAIAQFGTDMIALSLSADGVGALDAARPAKRRS